LHWPTSFAPKCNAPVQYSGYPFGEAIDWALRKALEIAGGLGFKPQYGGGG
jgi:hypothetical protein